MVYQRKINSMILLVLIIAIVIALGYTASLSLSYVKAETRAQIEGTTLKETACKPHFALFTLSDTGTPIIYTASCDECQRSEDCPYYPLQICVRECVDIDQNCYRNCLISCGKSCRDCVVPCLGCIVTRNAWACYSCISCVSMSCTSCVIDCRNSCCTWCNICKWKDYNVHSILNNSLIIKR